MQNALANGNDGSRTFVAQNHRFLDDEIADSPVFKIVNVRPANTDYPDVNLHFAARGRGRKRNLFDAQIARAVQDGGGHGLCHRESSLRIPAISKKAFYLGEIGYKEVTSCQNKRAVPRGGFSSWNSPV